MYPADQSVNLNSADYKDIDTHSISRVYARAADDSYPPPAKSLWQYRVSDFLALSKEWYLGIQKIIYREGRRKENERDSVLRSKFIRKSDWLDDLLVEAIDVVSRIRFFPDVDIPINAISIDAYASQFQWIDWSRKVVNGPPSNIHREVY